MEPKVFYETRLNELQSQQKKLQSRKTLFGVLRLGSLVAIIAVFYFLWQLGLAYVFSVTAVILIVFVRLVYIDLQNKAAIRHMEHLIHINEDECKALDGEYYHFKNGATYLPKEHLYAADMDIFGHASLYQFVNRTTSDMGAQQLAAWLLDPAAADEIIARQKAIKELSAKITWQQELIAYGKETCISNTTYQRLQQWLLEPTLFLQFKPWRWLRIVLPAIIVAIVTGTITGIIPMNVMYISLLLFAVLAFQINKIISPLHERLSKMVDEMDVLSQSIALIETTSFVSPMLLSLQQIFITKEYKASVKIRKLKKILDRLDIRYNIVISAPLNLLLLWNLQQVLDLERWKKQYAVEVQNWFYTLGVFEALNSFATIHFNNPEWCFPVLREKHFSIEATGLGHPLINKKKRVNNFIKMDKSPEIMLVTGSNMAGKSTYLRSVGVNTVLAMAGSVVTATSFLLSPVQLISSMRIADNLEESTSTFYAELKKLKIIIDKVNNGEKLFILLDEILRGTNSLDRHTGSIALIKQLIKKHASGIIATHDLALAALEAEYPNSIVNYHFDVQVHQEELYFDYKLQPGVCSSLNASLLMKKIGIEL